MQSAVSPFMLFTTLPAPYGSVHGFMPKPIEVRVGGATVFVIDVEQFYKF